MTSRKTGIAFRNKVRGAISVLKNKKPSTNENQHLNSVRIAAQAINEALSEAKSTLPRDELLSFERWLDIQRVAINHGERIASSQEMLGILPKTIKKIKLQDALQQAVDTIQRHRKYLGEFISQLKIVNKLIGDRQYENADNLIDEIVKNSGVSYWSVEAKIAILYKAEKVENAKEFIGRLSIGAAGLNSFYFYHFGLRNEKSQSAHRYKSIVKRRLTDSSLAADYQTYALFRTSRVLEASATDLSTVLSYELLTTKIDLLLTSQRVAIQILTEPEAYSGVENKLAREIIASTYAELLSHEINGECILVLPAKMTSSIREAVHISLKENRHVQHKEQEATLAKGLASLFSYSGSEADEDLLRKEALNFWWQPEAMFLESCRKIVRLPDIFSSNYVHDYYGTHPVNSVCMRFFHNAQSTDQLIANAIGTWTQQTNYIDRPQDLTSTVLDCISVRESWTFLENCDYTSTLRAIQRALLRNPRLIAALPLDQMFGGADFERISSFGIGLDLCNCLHRYSQINPDRKLKTYKRFVIEELLERLEVINVVDLAKKIVMQEDEKNLVEYFLVHTCDIATIELLDQGAEGTIEALQIRVALLRLAAEISEESRAQLTSEADSIAEQLKLDGVLEELDKTKVSVDEESLLPIVIREISGDFERYKNTQSSNSTSGSSVEELVWSLKQQSASTFQIPKNEADDLLVQMIYAVLDRFIDDPVYGLDAIVGRRIRHGTVSDELRGALEKLQLIGHRPKSGADYKLPKSLNIKIEQFDNANRIGVTKAFMRFSAAIDNLVAILRDEVFYSRQPRVAKPKQRHTPVFDLPLGVLTVALARDAAKTAGTVEQFIRELFDMFWFQLSASVERDRPHVGNLINQHIKDAFARLFSDVKASGINDATFLAVLQRASEELHLRGEGIKNWVRIPKMSYEGKKYPLSMVYDAAMAFAKSKRPGFEPEASVDIDADISLDAHGFPIAFDAVRIAIENIAKHSGVKGRQKLKVSINLNEDGDKLLFLFESDMSKDAWTKDKAQKVEAIREDIRRKNYGDRARKTSESGIAKLATIVKQRESCAIDFGPIDGGSRFKMYFELSYISYELINSAQHRQ